MIYFFIILLAILFLYWRFFWFFKDPERHTPTESEIVAPADGQIVYIKEISSKDIAQTVYKKGSKVPFSRVPVNQEYETYYHVGIFMSLFDVHVNRAPISGSVTYDRYFPAVFNYPMTMLWIRLIFNLKPYDHNIPHITENERNIMIIQGNFPLYLIQIADIYVRKIKNFVSIGDEIEKGERIGIIKMGSQVDLVFPKLPSMTLKVKEGDKVQAGVSIIS